MTNICLPKQSRDTDSYDKNTQFVRLSGCPASRMHVFDMTVLSVVSPIKSTAYDGQTRGIKHFVATVSKLYRQAFEFCAASHCDAKRYLYRDYHGAMTNYQANISTRYYTGCLSPNLSHSRIARTGPHTPLSVSQSSHRHRAYATARQDRSVSVCPSASYGVFGDCPGNRKTTGTHNAMMPKNPAHVRHSEAIAVPHGPILDSGHTNALRASWEAQP